MLESVSSRKNITVPRHEIKIVFCRHFEVTENGLNVENDSITHPDTHGLTQMSMSCDQPGAGFFATGEKRGRR